MASKCTEYSENAKQKNEKGKKKEKGKRVLSHNKIKCHDLVKKVYLTQTYKNTPQ